MNSFKNVRELLLLSYVNNVVSDREFVLLYDAYQSKNPDFNYQQYDPFNLDKSMGAIIHNPDRSDREKWSTSKGGPVFSKLFQLDRTDPLSFGLKFPEILVEWIAPNSAECTDGPSVI